MSKLILKNRDGMALAMAMFAIVVIGALIAGAFFASTQDFRVGTNSLVAQRAFSAAEYGLNKTMAEWRTELNLSIPTGGDTTFQYANTDKSTAAVRITRLNDYTYLVVSEGAASPSTPMEARRRTSAILRLAYPSVKVGGAITLAGGGEIKGSTQIFGTNRNPTGWDCANFPGRDTTAVAYNPNATLTVQKPTNAVGSPSIYKDPNAAEDGTYIKYGDETWQTLVQNADVVLEGSTLNVGTVQPVGTETTCAAGLYNWGEPNRDVGSVKGCQTYFPIIYAKGDVLINQGRGQGILLVEGDLQVNGNFDFYGLVIVRDDINKGNGNPRIFGAAMARNANFFDDASLFTGTATWQYSKCALETALRGSARLLPARRRPWAEMW